MFCVLSGPFAFAFMGMPSAERDCGSHLQAIVQQRKNGDFGTERAELKSQHSQLIFWQETSLLKSSVSSSRKKETEKQTDKYNEL